MSLTLNMIVKNEEATLPVCLRSVRDFVNEIVIVDTGSDDSTVEIAKDLGAQVEHFEWCDDFSAARNYALSFVKTPWVLWLDADDLAMNPELIPDLVAKAQKKRVDSIWSIYQQDASCFQRRLQLFKPRRYRWEGVVHENPIPRNQALSSAYLSDLVVLHRKPRERGPQAARQYLDILLEKDPTNWIGIAESFKYLSYYPDDEERRGEYETLAQDYYWRAFNYPEANDPTRYAALFNGAKIALNHAKSDKDALEWATKQAQLGVGLSPERAECWVILGQCWECHGNQAKAVECYEVALRQELPSDTVGLVFQGYYREIPQKLLDALKQKPKPSPEIWTP